MTLTYANYVQHWHLRFACAVLLPSFSYLGSTTDRQGGASKYVGRRVQRHRRDHKIWQETFNEKERYYNYQKVIRPTLLYGHVSNIWKDNVNNRDQDGAMDNRREPTGTLQKWGDVGGRNVRQILMVMRWRMLEWYGNMKRKREKTS